jgi:hypothetical protein
MNEKKILSATWDNNVLKDVLLWLVDQPPNDDGFITWRGGPLRSYFDDYPDNSVVPLNQNRYYCKVKVRVSRALVKLEKLGALQRLDLDGGPVINSRHTTQVNLSTQAKKFVIKYKDFL